MFLSFEYVFLKKLDRLQKIDHSKNSNLKLIRNIFRISKTLEEKEEYIILKIKIIQLKIKMGKLSRFIYITWKM